MEQARNCNPVKCPPELWGGSRRDLQQNLAALTFVRNSIFTVLYPGFHHLQSEELLFETLDGLLESAIRDLRNMPGLDTGMCHVQPVAWCHFLSFFVIFLS